MTVRWPHNALRYVLTIFEERMIGMGNGRKMAEFIAFFVAFKQALDEESNSLPEFASSRTSHAIDEHGEREILYSKD